jgi:hypothetical protein
MRGTPCSGSAPEAQIEMAKNYADINYDIHDDVELTAETIVPAEDGFSFFAEPYSEPRDGRGVLPAAIGANAREEGLICPAACGAEAAWASSEMEIIAAASLIQLANHFRGTQVLARPQPKIREASDAIVDLKDIKGQESAKRALEVAAAYPLYCAPLRHLLALESTP